MRKRLCTHRKWFGGLLLALLCLQVAVGSALADASATHIELILPESGEVGGEFMVEAVLIEDNGPPIEGVQVEFLSMMEFANVSGEVEIGRAFTDESGTASLAYLPRSSGVQTITARFVGDAQHAQAQTSATVPVESGPQIYTEEVGVSVPGIGVWLLAVVLGAVWIAFLFVITLLGLIAGTDLRRFPYLR